MADEANISETGGFLSNLISEIIQSPLNIVLFGAIVILLYKIFKRNSSVPTYHPQEPPLPKLKKDFTVEELQIYDGTQPEGRVLMAVNGNVYDVTKGKRFYGPGGPYSAFAGRDASRGLATFAVETKTTGYDDLSDLNSEEMDSVREWEAQFKEKYDYVGRLLKPGEAPTNYSEEEEDEETSGSHSVGRGATPSSSGDKEKEKKDA